MFNSELEPSFIYALARIATAAGETSPWKLRGILCQIEYMRIRGYCLSDPEMLFKSMHVDDDNWTVLRCSRKTSTVGTMA